MTNLGRALVESVSSDASADLLAAVADMGLDAAITSGALDGVPVFSLAASLWRAGKEVQQQFFIRKVIRFLGELEKTDEEARRRFSEGLKREGKTEEFGETILLILERIDDTKKPRLIGRVMAAHVRGELDYAKAMRLVAIISRCYGTDLEFLRTFQKTGRKKAGPVVESLFAAGLLSQSGNDGVVMGAFVVGGPTYQLNEYGSLLLKHALA